MASEAAVNCSVSTYTQEEQILGRICCKRCCSFFLLFLPSSHDVPFFSCLLLLSCTLPSEIRNIQNLFSFLRPFSLSFDIFPHTPKQVFLSILKLQDHFILCAFAACDWLTCPLKSCRVIELTICFLNLTRQNLKKNGPFGGTATTRRA